MKRKFSVTVWDSVTNETSQHAVELKINDIVPAVAIHMATQEAQGDDVGGWRVMDAYRTSIKPLRMVTLLQSVIDPAHLSSESIVEIE